MTPVSLVKLGGYCQTPSLKPGTWRIASCKSGLSHCFSSGPQGVTGSNLQHSLVMDTFHVIRWKRKGSTLVLLLRRKAFSRDQSRAQLNSSMDLGLDFRI